MADFVRVHFLPRRLLEGRVILRRAHGLKCLPVQILKYF